LSKYFQDVIFSTSQLKTCGVEHTTVSEAIGNAIESFQKEHRVKQNSLYSGYLTAAESQNLAGDTSLI
jgi:hypothetical protein